MYLSNSTLQEWILSYLEIMFELMHFEEDCQLMLVKDMQESGWTKQERQLDEMKDRSVMFLFFSNFFFKKFTKTQCLETDNL